MTHPYTTDEADWRYLMSTYGPSLNRCAGGRYRIYGYICALCGSARPERECLSPTPEKKIISPPGRHVLIDGKECTLVELEDGR